uniref:B12-binding domain-containing radical SAM protein n=1 Tax=Micromonospora acroterricola TaxID=2202421 RepID=UPI0013753830|nr:radical SAM protein [Micromonospora acroterricola]
MVLLQPPYLRALGSHNDRYPLELAYYAAHLRNEGHEALLVNADFTGSAAYIEWQRLFRNYRYLVDAMRFGSPLVDETVERVVGLDPDVVVVSAGDSLVPWVDSGNAYWSAMFSGALRKAGLFTVGVGPFFDQVPERFREDFDAILLGLPSAKISEVVRSRAAGCTSTGGFDVTVAPLRNLVDSHQAPDTLITSAGCPHSCTFCLGRDTGLSLLPRAVIERDLSETRSTLVEIGDAIAPSLQRLSDLQPMFSSSGRHFSCEITVRQASPRRLDALRQAGVRVAKMGIESGDDEFLRAAGKKQSRSTILEAVRRLKDRGFHVVAYVLLGGPSSTPAVVAHTYDLCVELGADEYVVNVWSHHDLANRDFRYDAHFSSTLAEEWGVSEYLPRFFNLQGSQKMGLGRIIRYG